MDLGVEASVLNTASGEQRAGQDLRELDDVQPGYRPGRPSIYGGDEWVTRMWWSRPPSSAR